MTRRRQSWLVFAICVALAAVALGWLSTVVLRLERMELEARAETEFQQRTHRALWRMDSWLSLFVAREAARPYTEYLPTDPDKPAGPLLGFKSDYLRFHFHVDPDDGISSPQFPGEAGPSSPVLTLNSEAIAMALAPAESRTFDIPLPEAQAEFNARVQCTVPAPPGQAEAGGKAVDVGPLVPVWLPENELAFVRQLGFENKVLYQGFLGDWPALSRRLLREIHDLFPEAKLEPVPPTAVSADSQGRYLANVPVALVAHPFDVPSARWTSPTRTTLLLAWLATLAAALMVGMTLHKSLELGERRRRFVSAVTHELRTPLTTFRMYSEMLADGVVHEEAKRQEYLETLKDEASRLSTMVDNVLAHSRLEEQGTRSRGEALSLQELLSRIAPALVRQAESGGMALETRSGAGAEERIEVDVEAVAQVLRNLIDNAVKYGRNGRPSPLELFAEAKNHALIFELRDQGPGVPPRQARAIFKPFDRGGRDPADPAPGIGLGLALARGLARDMGGDLTLERQQQPGACFRLSIPVARPAG